MCPVPAKAPRPPIHELLEELARAEKAYRNAAPEQWYLAIRKYTELLQRFSREMVRGRREGRLRPA